MAAARRGRVKQTWSVLPESGRSVSAPRRAFTRIGSSRSHLLSPLSFTGECLQNARATHLHSLAARRRNTRLLLRELLLCNLPLLRPNHKMLQLDLRGRCISTVRSNRSSHISCNYILYSRTTTSWIT